MNQILTRVLYYQSGPNWFMKAYHNDNKEASVKQGPYKSLENMLIDQFCVPMSQNFYIKFNSSTKVWKFKLPDLFKQSLGGDPFVKHEERLEFKKNPYTFFTKKSIKQYLMDYKSKPKIQKQEPKKVIKEPKQSTSNKYDYPADCITSKDKRRYRQKMRKLSRN